MATELQNRCPRCLQLNPARSRRCAHCSEFLPGNPQKLMMVIGGIGVLFLLAIIGLAIFMKPFEGEVEQQPGQEQTQPKPAAKKPPLN